MFKHILTDQTTDIIRSAQPVRMNGIYIDCIKVYLLERVVVPHVLLQTFDSGENTLVFLRQYRLTRVMHADSS